MNETFIRLITALAFCDSNPDPATDNHRRWTEILRAIWKTQHPLAMAFLASVNRNGLPNESPAELVQRAHHMAKTLLPDLAVKQQTEQREAATETNYEKMLREKSKYDPFLDGEVNLTRDSYTGGKGEPEPDAPTFIDKWGNVIQS
jgi:hypothetical protein